MDAQPGGHSSQDERCVAKRGELNENDVVATISDGAGYLKGKSGFADAARARQGNEPPAPKQPLDLGDLVLTPHEAGEGHWCARNGCVMTGRVLAAKGSQ